MSVLHMAWYTPETWRELDAVPGSGLQMTYPEFVAKVDRQIAAFAREGVRVVKLPIDVAQMVEWCRRHGYENDSKGRAAFGAALAAAQAAGADVMVGAVEDRTRSIQ